MLMQTPDRVQAVVFDWAGTLVDFGSFAPTQVLVEAFDSMGLTITLQQARGPMGMGKWDHIKALCCDPEVAAQFRSLHQREVTDDDVTRIYQAFLPLQAQRVADYSELIPGAASVLQGLRQQGIKIGSCSGYPRQILSGVIDHARQSGLTLDCDVATDEVLASRPAPGMILRNLLELGVLDIGACVKVDDTPVGIMEGHHAGVWTVALLLSGNAAGLTRHAFDALTEAQKCDTRDVAFKVFQAAKPHFCIDTVAQLPAVITTITAYLRRGIRPHHVGVDFL